MPDGRVAFTLFRHSKPPPEDWALDPVTRTQTRLPFAFDRTPAWSPDGTMIAAGSVFNATIEVGNADGTGLHGLPTMDGDSEPAWSPDGTRIAFTSSGTNTLGVIGADGTGLTIFPAPRDATSPAWSPDGSSIMFAWRGDGVHGPGIYAIAPDGSALHLSVGLEEPPGALCWSPDGTTLAFTTESSVTRLLPDGSVTGADAWKLWIQGPFGPSLIASGTTENGGATPLAWARGGGSVVTATRR
jgi:Tol biopolymer transport system component